MVYKNCLIPKRCVDSIFHHYVEKTARKIHHWHIFSSDEWVSEWKSKKQICLTLKLSENFPHLPLVCSCCHKEQKKNFFYSICKKVSELMEEYLNNIKLFCVLWNHRVELNFMYVEREREQKRAFLSIHNITNLLLLIHS